MFGEYQGILWKVWKEMESRVGRRDRQGLFAEAVLFLGSGSHRAFQKQQWHCGWYGANVSRKEDEAEERMGGIGAKSGLPSRTGWEVGRWRDFSSIAWWRRWLLKFLSSVKEMSPLSVWDLFVGIVRVRRGHIELVCALKPAAPLPWRRGEETDRRAQWRWAERVPMLKSTGGLEQ